MVKRGANVAEQGIEALVHVIGKNHPNALEFFNLFRGRFDLDKQSEIGATLLTLAARMNKLGLVQLLLQNGANPAKADINDRTPLEYAVAVDNPAMEKLIGDFLAKRQKEIFEILIEEGLSADEAKLLLEFEEEEVR